MDIKLSKVEEEMIREIMRRNPRYLKQLDSRLRDEIKKDFGKLNR